MPERLELRAQLGVIVNLAVKNERDVAVIASHRLITVLEVDDLQAYRAERHRRGFVRAVLIRAPMHQRLSRCANSGGIRFTAEVCESGNAAQTADTPLTAPWDWS